MKGNRHPVILIGVWVAVLLLLFRPQLHGMDTVAYYAWLRAAVIRGSLDVSEEFIRFGYGGERGLSPTGYRINEWSVGPALLWSPFFLMAHGLVRLGNALGIPWEADGYSAPYQTLTALGSALYALIGLELLRRLALRIASPAAALWGVLTAWLASPLVFYMSAHPFMSHAVDFFVNAGFLLAWTCWEKPTPWARLALGWIGGLAAAVRYPNATLLLWPALEDLRQALRAPREGLLRLLSLGVGAWIGFLPQMIVWRVVFGAWIVGNPYGIAGAGTFDLRAPHLLEVLFSTNRGLFPWTPIAAFALAGLVGPLRRARPAWARLLLAQTGAQLYIVGSWSVWSGAAAFGPRLLTGLFAGFALGLAALYEAGRRRWGMKPALALSLGAVAWNLILLARYGLEDVPRMGPVPLSTLWLGQLTFIGRALGELDRIGQALLRRFP
ncbi:MAG: hypothetical protein RQ891_01960 [Thermoflexus sp.]|jgi:hypothetical protein|nr:hypothetical protein [Thermoflexus sp.]MDT7883606.1 hypothetical protein [Thermoflexus sp.]MDT7947118.1 hypothetical protein [Thermoflexus sp.]